jgi:hypothetical protein
MVVAGLVTQIGILIIIHNELKFGSDIPADLIYRYVGGIYSDVDYIRIGNSAVYLCNRVNPHCSGVDFKRISPGAALVFLLTSPATNITSLMVLF